MGQHQSTSHAKYSKTKPYITRAGIEAYAQNPPRYSQLSLPPEYSARLSRQNPPIHLVLQVARHLDPVSRLSLRYTSLKLFEGLPFNVESELGKLPKASSQLVCQARDSRPRIDQGRRAHPYDLKREGRLQLLRHFLKDGFFGDAQSVCGACLDVHKDALFLPVELEKLDAERSCLGLTGKVWVCPHTSLTYDQVTQHSHPYTEWECFSCTTIHLTTPSQSSSRVCFPITRCLVDPPQDILTKGFIARELSYFGPASICPHLTIASLLPNPLYSSSPIGREPQRCPQCRTCFSFDTRPIGGSGITDPHLLRLIVERKFKGVKGVTDPEWLAHLVQKEEVVDESRTKRLDDGEPFARWAWNLDATEASRQEALEQCADVMHAEDTKDHGCWPGARGCIRKACLT